MGISDNDRDLFRKTIGKVKRIANDTAVFPKKRVLIHIHKPLRDSFSYPDMMSDDETWLDEDLNIIMQYAVTGFSRKTFRDLKQGKIHLDDSIDLHGLTVSAARDELRYFLYNALKQNFYCIEIIHGRGLHSAEGSILRRFVNRWLRYNQDVLAFSNAPQSRGGQGSTYCLLRACSPGFHGDFFSRD